MVCVWAVLLAVSLAWGGGRLHQPTPADPQTHQGTNTFVSTGQGRLAASVMNHHLNYSYRKPPYSNRTYLGAYRTGTFERFVTEDVWMAGIGMDCT